MKNETIVLVSCIAITFAVLYVVTNQQLRQRQYQFKEDAVSAGYATKLVDVTGKEVVIWNYQLKQK